MIGYPMEAADRIRSIAQAEYNNTSQGMSGNEDLGQMSAWYIFSALGFYPVNPASDEYVVGTPFFEKVTIRFPPGVASGGCVHCPDAEEKTLTISAPGAPSRPYIKGLSIDGRPVLEPIIKHADLVSATTIRYDMSDSPTSWGQGQIW
ncbi:hypothetical protein KEM55_002372 [Ascosphaera atra]|nr:hypothetical protein KEM55_002372 [Ascosphaera atra]